VWVCLSSGGRCFGRPKLLFLYEKQIEDLGSFFRSIDTDVSQTNRYAKDAHLKIWLAQQSQHGGPKAASMAEAARTAQEKDDTVRSWLTFARKKILCSRQRPHSPAGRG